jgi:hypothetical protein
MGKKRNAYRIVMGKPEGKTARKIKMYVGGQY